MKEHEPMRVARATALLAANGYALIQTMAFVANDPAATQMSVWLVLIPAFGMAAAYSLLENPYHRRDEIVSGFTIALMLLLWMAQQWSS